MCTVTVIAMPGGGYRLVHARDELRTRAPGLAPQQELVDGTRAWLPRDPDAGGTWLAARADGLTLGLLNVNIPPNGRPEPTTSRGHIITDLLGGADALSAAQAWTALDLTPYAPHRLIAVGRVGAACRVFECRWDGLEATVDDRTGPAACFASSGLGDEKVQVRLPLFEEMVAPDPTPDAQDRYHRHRWDDRPELSVLMSRRDARTVSLTGVTVRAGAGSGGEPDVWHEDLPEGEAWCDPVGVSMGADGGGER